MEHHSRDIVGHYGQVRARNVALINGDTGFSITWAELDQQVGRLAGALRNEFGIVHGDRVGLIADSEPKVFVLQYACMRLGAIFVPFNWRLTVEELAYQCGDADVSLLIHDEIWAHQAKELNALGGTPLLAWGVDDAPSEYTTLVERSEYLGPTNDASWDDVTHILYTSGTTGRPKGALSTHRSLAWQAINIASVDEVAAPDAHHLNSMPLFHAGGLNVFSNPILFFGGRVTTMARLDPTAVLRILGDPAAGVTHFTGVPTIYQMLTTFPEFQDTDYSHVRHAVCAGGIATPALLELWAAHGSPLEPQFGGTETGPTILMLDARDLQHSTTGAVGVPIAHTDVRLVDPITDADVARGEVGELLVRGPSITPGYWNRDSDQFFTDGYFRTGDALYCDDEGYFHYAGRFKDMYKSGGENVYAAEVEVVLQNVAGVAEIAIIGVPDERWGEVGLAVVVTTPGVEVTLTSLATACDGILARYKVPKHLVLVDSLPRNVTGKVAKADLRTAYAWSANGMTTFDHHSVEFAAGWRNELRGMRQHCPVAHTDAHDSYWVVTKYADAQRVLRDHKVFASARDLVGDGWSSSGGVTIPTNQGRMGFMEMDPPESLAYRKIINPWLSRSAVREYRPRIAEVVDWTIDQFIEDGTVDVVTQVANPIPAIVTLDVLGIDLVDWRTYAEAAHGAAFREPGSGTKLKQMMQNVREIVRDGTHDPGGLIASWKDATVAGEPISDDMVCELIFMVVNGGTDTTTSLIANSVIELQRRTDLRQRLVAEPALVPAAVQELLRYCVPSTGVARTTLAPTEIGCCPIGAGERVLLLLASTNFDDEQFPHPDELDFDRPSNQHLSFGTGGHRCVGAELATAELEVFLERFLARIPDFHVDLDGVQPYPTMPLVNGHIAVPTTFSPGPRVSPLGGLPRLTQPRLQPND